MSQSLVCNNPCEDAKFSTGIKEEHLDAPSVTNIDNIKPDHSFSTIMDEIYIKEEPLDAPSVTNIDSIKPDSPCLTIKAEIGIKEEPLESIDEFGLNVEMRSSGPLKSNSSNLKVCGIHCFLVFYCLI